MSVAFPLRVSPNGRHLVDQNGVPFLGRIDSPWNIAQNLTTSAATTYVADRVARGYNCALVECIDNLFTAGSSGQNANGDLPFLLQQNGSTYTNGRTQLPDFTTPNSAYWTQLDATLALFFSAGFLVFLYPSWAGFSGNGPTATDEGYYQAYITTAGQASMRGYGQFVASRYSANKDQIFWMFCADINPADHTPITNMALGVLDILPNALVSVDCTGDSSPPDVWSAETWWNQNNIYVDDLLHPLQVPTKCATEYARASAKPFFYKEGAYENEQTGNTPQKTRAQSWEAMLGGCWGFAFGNNPMWFFGSGYAAQLGSRGNLDAQVCGDFFAARKWQLLVPDTSNALVTNQVGLTAFAPAALSSDLSWACVYTPISQGMTLHMLSLGAAAGNGVNSYWLDPTNGARTFAGSWSSVSKFFSPPANNAQGDTDWVLELQAKPRVLSRWGGG